MSRRPDSVFKSTKVIIEQSAGLTADTVRLIRNELQHTQRLNSLENDAEFDETLMLQIDDVLTAMEALTDSKADTMKKVILEKRLTKLSQLM